MHRFEFHSILFKKGVDWPEEERFVKKKISGSGGKERWRKCA